MYSATWQRDAYSDAFEAARVQFLMRRIGATPAEYGELTEISGESTEYGRWTFAAVATVPRFSTLPVALACRSYGSQMRRRAGALFARFRFDVTYMFNDYLDWWRAQGSGTRPSGFVVNWIGVRGGAVLHDAAFTAKVSQSVYWHVSPKPKDPEYGPPRMLLEAYPAFVRRMLMDWVVDRPVWPLGPPPLPMLGVHPAVVADYGPAAGIVYGQLVKLAHAGMPVVITAATMKAQTGLGERAVRNNLAALHRAGLIQARKTRNGTAINFPVSDSA